MRRRRKGGPVPNDFPPNAYIYECNLKKNKKINKFGRSKKKVSKRLPPGKEKEGGPNSNQLPQEAVRMNYEKKMIKK